MGQSPEYEVYIRKSYPTKEEDSQGYAGFRNQGEALISPSHQYNIIFTHNVYILT
jgi:hypothetical protein